MMTTEVTQTFPLRPLNPQQPLSSERLIFAQRSVVRTTPLKTGDGRGAGESIRSL